MSRDVRPRGAPLPFRAARGPSSHAGTDDAPDDAEAAALADAHALAEATRTLWTLASLHNAVSDGVTPVELLRLAPTLRLVTDASLPPLEARYRTLLEQISAIVFMAYLDRGIGEAYVSPQIEATLGFTQQEWLEDPVRWYQQIHPDDKQRWSAEAAAMFCAGGPLRSVYRVLARDGHIVWFHCEAKVVRRPDGRPWFIQGVAFDITDLKQAEAALHDERNVLSAILDTAGALVVVLAPDGRIARFNRACELTTGYTCDEVKDRFVWDLFMLQDEIDAFRRTFAESGRHPPPQEYETSWITRTGALRRIAWSSTVLPHANGSPEFVVATGIDITERRRLQKTILEISDKEERRIGQDLHDGLGQHLTGIAFMSKVLEQKLVDRALPEAADASKILMLVKEAINKTRELARGLLPIVSDAHGLMSALKQIATDVEDLFGLCCRFDCAEPVLMSDVSAATHLCHIAREAVNNAVRHAEARHIAIGLTAEDGMATLTIRNDGRGFPTVPTSHEGMGLHIMHYRATMLGGTLHVDRAPDATTVTCVFPLHTASRATDTASRER